VGGGHDAAARAVGADLSDAGYDVVVENALRRVGRWAEWLIVSTYTAQLHHAPWSYDALYRAIVRIPPFARFLKWLTGFLGARRIGKLLDAERPDLVFTTYHLASAMLARLRRKGRLPIPAAALITDLAPHPMWIYPGLDAHIVLHPSAAPVVDRASRGPVYVARPPVQPKFRTAQTAGRAGLGLGRRDDVALVVGGDWGVGSIERAAHACADAGWRALIVCGRNEHLRRRLERAALPGAVVFGFVDDMPSLMDAADVVVLSGPGATCLESFARRRPIVFFEPIAGHGVDNARYLEQCGLARFPRSEREFVEELRTRSGHGPSLEVARSARLFDAPSCADVLLRLHAGRAPKRRTLRRATALVAGMAALLSLTGSGVSAEMRVLRRPAVTPGGSGPEVALCLRVGDQLGQAAVALRQLEASGAHATFFVSGRAAAEHPDLVRRLLRNGDEIGNAGDGRGIVQLLFMPAARRGARRAAEDITEATGTSPRYYLPSGPLSLSQAIAAGAERPVLRARRQSLRQRGLRRGDVVVVDLRSRDGIDALRTLLLSARGQGLAVTDLSELIASRSRPLPAASV
jgi:UDP-N-acetylglucosamine:LPS N-acetylglucosamine transferase/peptidoglycan/xylan/chitin deacetylase (PgdA/CDA1 family)